MISTSRNFTSRWAAAASLTLALGLGLSACSEAEDSKRDDSGAITEENDKASVFDMQIGDCYDQPADTATVETLPAVPCDQPHDLEVYAEKKLPDGDYPGQSSVDSEADTFCTAEFDGFVGKTYDESALDYLSFTPTSQSWSQGDQEITCLIGSPDGNKLTGSVKGTAQ